MLDAYTQFIVDMRVMTLMKTVRATYAATQREAVREEYLKLRRDLEHTFPLIPKYREPRHG